MLEIISWEKLRFKNQDIINFPPESARLHQIWKLLSTSIYDLVLLDVCHFHHHHHQDHIVAQFSYFQSIYRDTRAYISDSASKNLFIAF